jgi:hypothetical protein
MLSSENFECGCLENGKLIVRSGESLYEMGSSLYREALLIQNDSTSENPLLNIMKVLGITSLRENLTERLRELSSEAPRNENEQNPKLSRMKEKTNNLKSYQNHY